MMKYRGTFPVLSAGILMAVLSANGAICAGNPYTPIATRNVFCLQSVALAKPPTEVAVPPVTISLTGITTILGSPEVLFKTSSAAKNGGPLANEFYTLGEGRTKDDIEVVSIDAKDGLVIFRNHGVIQMVEFAKNSAVASR